MLWRADVFSRNISTFYDECFNVKTHVYMCIYIAKNHGSSISILSKIFILFLFFSLSLSISVLHYYLSTVSFFSHFYFKVTWLHVAAVLKGSQWPAGDQVRLLCAFQNFPPLLILYWLPVSLFVSFVLFFAFKILLII